MDQPQDEVKAFETRASKNVKKGIPGLPPPADKPKPANATKQEKTKKVPVCKDSSEVTTKMACLSVNSDTLKAESATASSATSAADKDPAKRLKSLKKKLREIVDIESKPVDTLTPEQVEKVSKKESIELEIVSLAQFDK